MSYMISIDNKLAEKLNLFTSVKNPLLEKYTLPKEETYNGVTAKIRYYVSFHCFESPIYVHWRIKIDGQRAGSYGLFLNDFDSMSLEQILQRINDSIDFELKRNQSGISVT